MKHIDATVSMMAIVKRLERAEKDLAEWKRINGIEDKRQLPETPKGLKRFGVRIAYPDVSLPEMPIIQATYSVYAESQKEAEWKVKRLAAASMKLLLRIAKVDPDIINNVMDALITVIWADLWRDKNAY